MWSVTQLHCIVSDRTPATQSPCLVKMCSHFRFHSYFIQIHCITCVGMQAKANNVLNLWTKGVAHILKVGEAATERQRKVTKANVNVVIIIISTQQQQRIHKKRQSDDSVVLAWEKKRAQIVCTRGPPRRIGILYRSAYTLYIYADPVSRTSHMIPRNNTECDFPRPRVPPPRPQWKLNFSPNLKLATHLHIRSSILDATASAEFNAWPVPRWIAQSTHKHKTKLVSLFIAKIAF